MLAKVAVFSNGPREYIIEGIWYTQQDEDYVEIIVEVAKLDHLTMSEHVWREYKVENNQLNLKKFVRGYLWNENFKEGKIEVLFLSGPEFDAGIKHAGEMNEEEIPEDGGEETV